MKKILFLSVILLMCVSAMQAIPAHPGTAKVRQPDGSYVTLRLLGDEWMRFNTTVDGYSVVKNQRGYYVYAEQKEGRLLPTTRVAHDMAERSAGEQAFLQGVRKYQKPLMADAAAAMKVRMETDGAQRRAQGRRATDYSNFKGLVILVQFDDKDFSRADYPSILKDMVNKPGYSGYDDVKMPGSVLDYFSDNSGGKFRPQFDIVGPYHVNYSQYDCNLEDGKCDDILIAALDSADADVNFKHYDGNGDGMVDLVYFVVAGLGSNCTGNNDNLWWPHRAQIWDDAARAKGGSPYVYKDGVLLWDYASSTELTGFEVKPTTIIIDGIGSICHEFSHVLGLPDFYDTNYEEGGLSNTIGYWSVMDQGCYLNDGYSPAGYSLYERYSVGFIDEPAKIEREGSYILNPLSASYTGLRIDSQEKDEFFLLENRQRDLFKWDAWLPASGMLVYRVDRSNKEVWTRNTVNAVPDHNYYQLVRAGGTGKGAAFDVFPGKGSVTVLNNTTEPANLLSWSGKATKWGLSDIRQSQGVISFTVHDAITLTGITLPDSLEVPLGVHAQLEALLTPDGAEAVLQWSSSNQNVATVNQQGLVKGIAAGTCTITVTSDNGISARCQVTVQSLPVVSVDELKHKELDTKVLLQLTGAEVLYAYEDMTFLRDASGCLLISGANLGLKRNDRVTGTVCGQVAEMNNMMQLTSAGVATNADNLTVSEGPAVQPRTVHPADLTEADYADYVLVKAVQLERDNGVWAVIGNRRIRLNNYFQIQGINLPMSMKGKYYDVEAIYGTNVLDDQVIDELYRTAKVVEVEPPTGIVELHHADRASDAPVFNLQGQRVSPHSPGLLIRGGRKLLNR